jgi:2-haloacid dehalogenase
MERHADFRTVTADALDYALEACGIEDASLRETLPAAYLRLDAYPEARPTLAALRASGRRTAILSNGTPDMLSALVGFARLDELVDDVLSVEEVGIFKPAPRVYRLACERLGVDPAEICFLSSNAWDVAGAASFGMTVVWVNRAGAVRERLPGAPAAEIASLDALLPLAELR